MKVRVSIKPICDKCKIIKRHGKIRVKKILIFKKKL